jgi:hypothetical protein
VIADAQDTIFGIYGALSQYAIAPPECAEGLDSACQKLNYCKMTPFLQHCACLGLSDNTMLPLAGGAVGALMGQGGWDKLQCLWGARRRRRVNSLPSRGGHDPSLALTSIAKLRRATVGFLAGGPGLGAERESGLPPVPSAKGDAGPRATSELVSPP